jgi:hypothetical protein
LHDVLALDDTAHIFARKKFSGNIDRIARRHG